MRKKIRQTWEALADMGDSDSVKEIRLWVRCIVGLAFAAVLGFGSWHFIDVFRPANTVKPDCGSGEVVLYVAVGDESYDMVCIPIRDIELLDV